MIYYNKQYIIGLEVVKRIRADIHSSILLAPSILEKRIRGQPLNPGKGLGPP
jgi:hypothetical protein